VPLRVAVRALRQRLAELREVRERRLVLPHWRLRPRATASSFCCSCCCSCSCQLRSIIAARSQLLLLETLPAPLLLLAPALLVVPVMPAALALLLRLLRRRMRRMRLPVLHKPLLPLLGLPLCLPAAVHPAPTPSIGASPWLPPRLIADGVLAPPVRIPVPVAALLTIYIASAGRRPRLWWWLAPLRRCCCCGWW
jgi:hypothetical protein